MTNLEKIRQMPEQQFIELLLAATRDDLSYPDICSNCDTCVICKLCVSLKGDMHYMRDLDWKKWLESEVEE